MKATFPLLAALAVFSTTLPAERFAFSYQAGRKYHTDSVVKENIYENRRLLAHVEILNKIIWEVKKTEADRGYLAATFEVFERDWGSSDSYSFANSYTSEYWRDSQGEYEIADHYYMPVVRNLPRFPDKDLKPGDRWSFPGEEKHDFRAEYNIVEPLSIPFVAEYEYLGQREWNGKKYATLSVKYNFFSEPTYDSSTVVPKRISGYSNQILYWDFSSRQLAAYEETFKFIFELSNGLEREYSGKASAKVTEGLEMDKNQIQKDIGTKIADAGISDVSVRKDDLGIVISLDNINFPADSSRLIDSEKAKIRKIAEILGQYPTRNLLVKGHTALAGTETARLNLSRQRAKAVGDYLVSIGARQAKNITTRGLGATEPIAENTTEEGMKKNRRVEIIILEN